MSRAEGMQQVVYIGIVKIRRNWPFVFLSFFKLDLQPEMPEDT